AGDQGSAVAGRGEALAGHREATFDRVLLQLERTVSLEAGVDHHPAPLDPLRVRAGVDEQAPARSDLGCGQPGAVGGVVGLEHVRDQGADVLGDLPDLAGALFEGPGADDGERADGPDWAGAVVECRLADGGDRADGKDGASPEVAGWAERLRRRGGLTASRCWESTIHGPRSRCSGVPSRTEPATARPSRSAWAESSARKSMVWVACGSSWSVCQACRPEAICRARRNSASRAAPEMITMLAIHSSSRMPIRPLRTLSTSVKRAAWSISCPRARAEPNSTSTDSVEPRVISR